MSNWFSHNTKETLMTFWIALFIILLVAELISVGLTTIWFAIGALAALVTCADQAVLTFKSLEAFAKAADGKSTKIIVPSEIQGIAGMVKSITEVAADQTD